MSLELPHLLLTHPRNRKVQFGILAKCCGVLTENSILFRNCVLFCSKVLDCAVMTILNNSYSMMNGVKVSKESSNNNTASGVNRSAFSPF